jgi:16S rRNA (cytosine1402-N4)-methyltransferase
LKYQPVDSEHIPVLEGELAGQIKLPSDSVMVDATIGQGGHSLLFGQSFDKNGTIVGFDIDNESLKAAEVRLSGLDCNVILIRENFSRIKACLEDRGIEKVDFILADLGFCSAQLEDDEKGLSFQREMPLDMRLDERLQTTAADIINSYDEKSLADLIYKYGQDRASRRIARFIVTEREKERITKTTQLASVVLKALRRGKKKKWSRIHPATRTFQALRIAVNRELENLKKLLSWSPSLLKSGGYIAVISFHSLEDRIVKWDFKERKADKEYEILTKKPVCADKTEIERNPRSRSAKLRIARKL